MDNNLEITKKPGNKKVTIINIILIIAIFILFFLVVRMIKYGLY